MEMSLTLLSLLLGLAVLLPSIYGYVKPADMSRHLTDFPRSLGWGYVLIAIATLWFLYNLNQESIADFMPYKKLIMMGIAALGVLTCIYVQDFLSVRGLAIILMLMGKQMVDTARWADTEWRLVIIAWAYAWVVAGMWFTISPWRLRDLLAWSVADTKRFQKGCITKAAFGVLLIILAVTVYR